MPPAGAVPAPAKSFRPTKSRMPSSRMSMMPPPEKPPPKSREPMSEPARRPPSRPPIPPRKPLRWGCWAWAACWRCCVDWRCMALGAWAGWDMEGRLPKERPPPRRAASAVSGRAYIQAPPSMMSMVRMALIFMGVSVRVKDARVLLFSIACTIAGLVKKARGAGLSRRDGRAFPRIITGNSCQKKCVFPGSSDFCRAAPPRPHTARGRSPGPGAWAGRRAP